MLRPGKVNFKEKWKCLEETVQNILKLEPIPRDVWHARFNDIYVMCGAFPEPHDDKLYESTKLLLETHVSQLLTLIQTEGTENQLQHYCTYWQKYSKGTKLLDSLYQYFNNTNRAYSATQSLHRSESDEPKMMMIGELTLDVWNRIIIIPLKDSMPKLLLDEFDKSRYKLSITTPLDTIAVILKSFIEVQEFNKQCPLELYQSYFEQPFLKRSSEYFKLESTKLSEELTVSEYMTRVLVIMKEEGIRANTYLHESTYNKLQSMFREIVVVDHLSFLHGESEAMIREERLNDMHNIYLLLRNVKDGFGSLGDVFRELIKKQGMTVLESLKKNQIYVHFVEDILELHTKYKSIVANVFNNDFYFSEALDTAFSIIVNYKLEENQPSKAPEYLSKYCDKLLKKSCKGLSEAEIEHKLLQSITIFKYINDKDIFQNIYQVHLAKRLILQQSQSTVGEEGMINNLKQLCGYEFANKLHCMFTDIRISEGLNTQFQKEILKTTKDKLTLSFSANILQTGAWPMILSTKSFAIPEQLITCSKNFEDFYKEKFVGRKLTWLHHHSQGELKLNYLPKMYIVTLHIFQMSILLLFENNDTLKYSEINEILQLSDDHFQKQINSLVNCKLLSLDGDNVKLNMNFSNKRTKLCITSAVLKDTPQEIEQSTNSVEIDREAFLHATIIRIMKMRKTLRHNKLVIEIISQTKSFLPSNGFINRSIKILIDKGYLECSPNLPVEYNYVA
ncbi:cullin-2-like [Acyrthosiphon pisum]|uniref:Cullin family profile domain-containing protein n=1 Tax=Acyrthosiphon pisum TaxID=7029 RepID=A0A8R2NV91_ACYPI|nr:cullin-2-like [Acyrthosiphon pisum]XP_029346982.1 cullin-2-like [Acyrthosiphon pisum]|eukprot:XP_001947566.1 PREDICTED: cullin-2-like [Acyrthosiphon pisum]